MKEQLHKYYLHILPDYLPKHHCYHSYPEQEKKVVQTKVNMIKPGKDYYVVSLAFCLLIFVFIVINFSSVFNKQQNDFRQLVSSNSQFSADLVVVIMLMILWIIFDRIIYKLISIESLGYWNNLDLETIRKYKQAILSN